MLAPPMGSPFSVPDQPPASSVLAPPPINRPPVFTPPPPHPNSHPLHHSFHPAAPPALDGSAPLPGFGYNFMANYPPNLPTSQIPFNVPPQPPQPEVPPGPPAIEHSNLNYLILSNFDEGSIKEKDVQTQVLFNRTFPKLKSTSPFPFPVHLVILTASRTPKILRTLRHHRLPRQIQRPSHRPRILQRSSIQRDPETAKGRVEVEQAHRRLCGPGRLCSEGRAAAVSQSAV